MGHDLSQDAEIWDDAYKLDRAHVFHSWHAQRNLDPTEVVTGHGVWLKYGDGREMLDFTSQQVNVNIGYQRPWPRRLPGGPPRSGRLRQGVLHQRWRRRQ